MSRLPHCPKKLPEEILLLIEELAQKWAKNPIRPNFRENVVKHWNKLIQDWSNDLDLPLYIRKMSAGRGQELRHTSGRILIPTDNSPAHFTFMLAYSGEMPDLQEIFGYIKKDEIPVAMALKRTEKAKAKYSCIRASIGNPNDFGWKVSHKIPIGLNRKVELTEARSDDLKEHFINFLNPSNMFLVPKAYSGLGELPEFVSIMRNHL